MPYAFVRKLIRTVGAIFALLFAIALPTVFGVMNYLDLVHDLGVQAGLHAQYLTTLAKDVPLASAAQKLPEALGTNRGTTAIRIMDAEGREVYATGPAVIARAATSSASIAVDDRTVGSIELKTDFTPVLRTSGLLFLLGCNLAVLIYLGVSKLPIVALDEATQQLEQRERLLNEKNAQLDAALSNMVQGLCLFDRDQKVVIANTHYAEMYGLTNEDIKPGTPLRDILKARSSKGAYAGQDEQAVIESGVASFGQSVSEIIQLSDGRYISVLRRPLEDGGVISTHEDVTERKMADAQIAHMAAHDALTGLPNRAQFGDKLARASKRASQSSLLAVLCLDLDHFKAVNDTLGHPMGDALLRAVAERLQLSVRDTDVVARLGGDEFAVLLTGLGTPALAASLAERIVRMLSEPYELDGHHIVIGCSVGIAVAPHDGSEAMTLLKNADLALYSAKAAGRRTFRFFEDEMDKRVQERRLLELHLRGALSAGQFELYYQPLIDLKSNTVVAMEALLRWNHPAKGRVSPADFIPVLEEIGLIPEVGAWVLKTACAEAATWPNAIRVAVNLSANQFKSGTLAFDIAAALASSGLDANRLELEITETTLLQNTAETLATLRKIRDLGVRIAMDDFGTGYSSLSYLHSFPFDKIKIDQCFVRDLAEKQDSLHILKAVVGLGANLGMDTTAEGVETMDQLTKLRGEGCTEVQGYLFSPPRPAHEIQELLRSINSRLAA